MTRQPTAIDLFSGAGGATQGLRDAGFQVLAAVENDPAAAATYHANHPDVVPWFDDIRNVPIGNLRVALGLQRGQLTLLKSCPPCQGFSTLGNRDRQDPINDLVDEFWPWIQEFRPAAFIVENVRGLAGDFRMARLKRRARGTGYRVREYLVDAADFGVPQRRRRLIVAGVRGPMTPPEDLEAALDGEFDIAPQTAADVFAVAAELDPVLDPTHRARTPTPSVLRRLEAIPPGGDRFSLPEDLQLDCHKSLPGRRATASYGRIKLDAPGPTMTTRCTTPACGQFVHPVEHRGITLREAALFQTFPATYEFSGSYGDVERQIGNAVPVRLAHALGVAVRAALGI